MPNQSDSADFFGVTPRFGFVWRVAPTVQVFGNASRAYEPPLLLELAAPGQIGGDLSQLNRRVPSPRRHRGHRRPRTHPHDLVD